MTQISGGLSRRINVLADKTLLAAYAGQTHTLTPAHLNAAAGDAEMPSRPQRRPLRPALRRWAWLSAGLAAALGLLVFVAWQALSQNPSPQATVQAPLAAPATSAAALAPTAAPVPVAEPAAHVTELARQTNAGSLSPPPAPMSSR